MSRPWMPLYVADYLADTGHLSGAEHGAYLLLIMHYWQTGSLPCSDRHLASIARATPEQWADMKATIAAFFGDNWSHARIDAELAKANEKYQKRANAGRLGGKAKAEGAKQSASNATALLYQPQPQLHTEKEEPDGSSKKRGTRLPADFEPDVGAAVSIGLSEAQARNEAVKFLEWWPAQPGQRGVKLDWNLTWRTWCRKALERIPQAKATSPPKQTVGQQARDELRRMGMMPNATDHETRHCDEGDRSADFAGSCIARRFAVATSR